MLAVGCSSTVPAPQPGTPAEVSTAYFTAWHQQDYETMYSLLSDGFKEIEPTAQTLEQFAEYARSQKIEGVIINTISESANDKTMASIDYDVTFHIAGKIVPYKGTFTLKHKQQDVVPGWKLIHPYGKNIDTT